MNETTNKEILSAEEIACVQNSWDEIREFGVQNPLIFYDVFFKVAPQARKYFKNDLSLLSKKFTYTVDFVINNCGRLSEIKDEIEDLGRIHNDLSIDPSLYTIFNEAFIGLLDKLKRNDIESSKQAWLKVLEHIGTIMQNAPAKKQNKFKALLKKLFG